MGYYLKYRLVMAYQRLDLGRTEVCGRWYMHMTNSAWAEADGQHNLVFFCSNHCLKWSYELALSFRHIWSRSQLQKTISDTRKILRALWKQQIWKLRLGNIYSKKICIDRYVASPPKYTNIKTRAVIKGCFRIAGIWACETTASQLI